MAHLLAIFVGLSGFILYMAAFFFPEVHRKNDFIWSGIIFFYALALWVYSGRITGGVLLGQVASVVVLGWLGWQTLVMRRQLTPYDQQTWVSGSGKSLGDVLFLNATQLGSQFKQRWEQLPLPAPLKGLPDQVGRTVTNLQTKPQPKAAPQAPTKTADGTPTEPRKVRKKPKATPVTPTDASELATTSVAEPGVASTEGTPEVTTAIAPSEPAVTESVVESAIAPTPPIATASAAVEPTEPSPPAQPTTLEPVTTSEPVATSEPTSPVEAQTNTPSVSSPPPVPKVTSTADEPPTGTPDFDTTPASAEPSPSDQQPEPETAADIPFTPPPGTEPTPVAHVLEVAPAAETTEATTPMEVVPPPDAPEPPTELSYAANTETTVPPLESSADAPITEEVAITEPSTSSPSMEPSEDVSNLEESAEMAEIRIDDVTPTNEPLEAQRSEIEEIEAPMPTATESGPETEWEAITQELWGGIPRESADEREGDFPQDSDGLAVEPDAATPPPVSEPTARTNGLDLSLPDVSESLQEEDWGEEDTEDSSNGPVEDWDMDWNEPPEEPTPIQPPPVQPIIEPEELTFADMVAAANRTLTPEDRVVVDVKAIAITDEESTPPVDNWDDWDEEDNDSWFDR